MRRLLFNTIVSYQSTPERHDIRTGIIMLHGRNIFTYSIDPMFSHRLKLAILWKSPGMRMLRLRARARDMYPHNMQTPIISGTSKTMDALQDTNTFHLGMVLCICMSRFGCDVSFKSCGIPDFDSFVVGGRDKECMIWRDGQAGDRVGMGIEVGYKPSFHLPSSTVSRNEPCTMTDGITPSDRTFVDTRAKIVLEFTVVVQIQILQKVADTCFLSI